jgi:putative endonuclease
MAQHLDLGRLGEQLAKTHLEGLGYEILDENWTHGKAEVDLIAYQNKTIIFVEVKARSGNWFGQPEDFVDNRKQKLLVDAANEYIYLMEHKGEVRFDIVSVLFDKQNAHILKHIPDAFWPSPTI